MLAHFPVFSTDCATYASHLEVRECRWGISWPRALDGYCEGHIPPLSSHGSCKPIDEHRGGHATEELRLVSPLPTGPIVLLPSAGSPPEWGHIANSGCGNTSTSVCVCVCAHACVCVCVCVCVQPH